MPQYLRQLLIAFDQFVNALVGGYADETLSAYAHRKHDWRRVWINRLFFWQDDHCKKAFESEMQRRHLPVEYRGQ